MKKITVLVMLMLVNLGVFAQEPEMATALRSSGKIYIVVAVISVIFIGLAAYLFSIDRRLKKIENQN
jgi:CcmD family protein